MGFQDQLWLNAVQKYCKMLQGEHSEILLTFITLPFAIKIFVLSIFEWPFYTGFTVWFTHAAHKILALAAWAQASLRNCTDSPEPLLLSYTKKGSGQSLYL